MSTQEMTETLKSSELGRRVSLPQGGHIVSPGVKQALYRVARFTLAQGAYPHFEQLALALTSRLYQALNLVPDPLSAELIREASESTEAQRMLMSVELAGRLSAWLSSRFEESQLSDLLQGVLWAMSASEGRLHSLLTALNLEVLAPLKVKLNPRKWIEAEERMGAALYQACLLTEPPDDSPALPQRLWPELPDYDILISDRASQGVQRFFAIRRQDQLRCWLYFSEELALSPKVTGSWPTQYMAPLERGEWNGLLWASVPSVSALSLRALFPYLDTYCSLSASEQALEILAALHHQGVSHLDFRPEHLIVDHRLQLRASPHLDAQVAERAWRGRALLPQTPCSVYVSPEQREGGDGDTRSDLWSYGALLFELFQGRPLIEVSALSRFPEALVASGEQPLQEEGLWIPEELRQLVERCVCDNPDERWADARLVLEAFRPIAQEIRSELKSQGRSAQWSRLIAEGHLLSFIEAEVRGALRAQEGEHEPTLHPELIHERFSAHLDDAGVALSSAEEPSTLLRELSASALELQENLIEWETIQSEAEVARAVMIEKIDRDEGAETFERLRELLAEKDLIIEALTTSEARIAELQERKPKLFYERLQRFIDAEELEISLERLVGVHVELATQEASTSHLAAAQPSVSLQSLEPSVEPAAEVEAALESGSLVSQEAQLELTQEGEESPAREPADDWYDMIDPALIEDEPQELEISEVAPPSAWQPDNPVPDFDDLSKIDHVELTPPPSEASGIDFGDLTGLDQLEDELRGPRDPFASAERWAPSPQLSVTAGELYAMGPETGERPLESAEAEQADQAAAELKSTDERLSSLDESPLESEGMFDEHERPALLSSELDELELRPTPSMLPIAVSAPPESLSEPGEQGEGSDELEAIRPHGVFQSPEEIKQVRTLYERFLTLKIEHDEPIDDISFEGFLEEINQAYSAYVTEHGAQAFKFSVHYRKGRVMLRARPVPH